MSDTTELDLTIVDRGDEVTPKTPTPTPAPAPEPVTEPETDKLDDLEETPEEKAEREREEAEAAKRKNIRIPKHRFDEAQAKARQRELALLEEIERLRGGQQTVAAQKSISDTQAQIEALQDKYEDLLLEGEKEEARKIRKQINALNDNLIEFRTTTKSEAARAATIEELSYNAQLASLETKYPALNPDSADFDEERTNEVAMLMKAFVSSGTKRPEALAKAVKYVMGAPQEQRVPDAAKVLAEERARKAREKAAKANAQQPPDTSRIGTASDKIGSAELGIDVMRLTQKQFAELSDEAKARLRGDEL